jgi:prepilin-type N-terminal cleavage/methylation domain-containing protein
MAWTSSALLAAPARRRGMTLLEVVVVTVLFAALALLAYGAVQSARVFSATNVSYVDLQEYGRQALEFITCRLRNAGRFAVNPPTDEVVALGTPGAREYPYLFPSGYYPVPYVAYPVGYQEYLSPMWNVANNQPNQHKPLAPEGVEVGGGDPTLDSSNIIFRVPRGISPEDPPANGVPRQTVPTGYLGYPLEANAVGLLKTMWETEEYSFCIVPGEDGINQLEYRVASECRALHDTGRPVEGRVISRFVDRVVFQDSSSDPALSHRQVRVTLYLTRVMPAKGALETQPSDVQRLSIRVSSVIDMRNNASFD